MPLNEIVAINVRHVNQVTTPAYVIGGVIAQN